MATTPTKTRRKKTKRNIGKGQVHVQSTFNNTIITITDDGGNVVAWASSGSAGFKGSRKSTPYAAQLAAEKVIGIAKDSGLNRADVIIKGIGGGREAAIRALQASGIAIASIKDITSVPHNGCRPRKPRRV
ncbi:30S ribosomal protein S11 [Candidatus Saccharibacteria bacterium]|nr:30S ribosomal protein S11 [Candidatus Saccharibacteria bacterium]